MFSYPKTNHIYTKGEKYNTIPNYAYSLYRIYNKKNELIYIGVTGLISERIRTHFNGYSNLKKYHNEFYRVCITEFPDFKSHDSNNLINAGQYERMLIRKLQPKYNVFGK